jgi:hypothetical protein
MIGGYDRKLMDDIKFELDLFDNKRIDLFLLVQNLESLFRRLTRFDIEWREKFLSLWASLEIICADMLNKENWDLKGENLGIVQDIVNEMRLMISGFLENYTKFSDPTITKEATYIEDDWLLCPECSEPWQSMSLDPMVICPKCNNALHNPKYKKLNEYGG